jgi:hypothetical protein
MYVYVISNFEPNVTGWSDWDFDLEVCAAIARASDGADS